MPRAMAFKTNRTGQFYLGSDLDVLEIYSTKRIVCLYFTLKSIDIKKYS